MRIQRLACTDRDLARTMFVMMAEVFETEHAPLGDPYLDALLSRDDFWALAALLDADVVGGLTGFALPLTRLAGRELFIYDIAVRHAFQRRGIGRELVTELRRQAAAQGIFDTFVIADNEDLHALDFYRNLGGVPLPTTMFTFPTGVAPDDGLD